jgi:hypothetical protein
VAAAFLASSLRASGLLAAAAFRAASLRLRQVSSVSVTVPSLPVRPCLHLRLSGASDGCRSRASGGDRGHEYQHSGVGVDLGAARLRPARLGALRAALGLDAGG